MGKEKSEGKSPYRLFLLMGMSTAILLASPVLILLTIGYFLDKFFHTAPLYMLAGIGIGFVSGIINVFRMIQMMQRKKKSVL